ncbi:hypothetical protein CEXT_788481 [Caerostris extrusa]|uniref:Uncharacterized protein n=1 Tax=Caerostris extrusa TaxID=172846 RepID=A0AAV4N5G4_CAEEX|nr:hypothetical protein CEXT_788481 [Caerostris extrusa]
MCDTVQLYQTSEVPTFCKEEENSAACPAKAVVDSKIPSPPFTHSNTLPFPPPPQPSRCHDNRVARRSKWSVSTCYYQRKKVLLWTQRRNAYEFRAKSGRTSAVPRSKSQLNSQKERRRKKSNLSLHLSRGSFSIGPTGGHVTVCHTPPTTRPGYTHTLTHNPSAELLYFSVNCKPRQA